MSAPFFVCVSVPRGQGPRAATLDKTRSMGRIPGVRYDPALGDAPGQHRIAPKPTALRDARTGKNAMLRLSSVLIGLTVALAGCGGTVSYSPDEGIPVPGVRFTGTAVMGVSGGSDRPTRFLSGLKRNKREIEGSGYSGP